MLPEVTSNRKATRKSFFFPLNQNFSSHSRANEMKKDQIYPKGIRLRSWRWGGLRGERDKARDIETVNKNLSLSNFKVYPSPPPTTHHLEARCIYVFLLFSHPYARLALCVYRKHQLRFDRKKTPARLIGCEIYRETEAKVFVTGRGKKISKAAVRMRGAKVWRIFFHIFYYIQFIMIWFDSIMAKASFSLINKVVFNANSRS